MKVIFLDVDGVLNNMTWAQKMYEEKGIPVFRDDILCESSLLLLQKLVQETGAQIVLSSSWRNIPSARANLVKTLEQYGLSIHSDTPYIGGIRGEDIASWMKRHPEIELETYVILDDDSDMLVPQFPHFVQTSFADGFEEKHYLRAKKILEGAIDCGEPLTKNKVFATALELAGMSEDELEDDPDEDL